MWSNRRTLVPAVLAVAALLAALAVTTATAGRAPPVIGLGYLTPSEAGPLDTDGCVANYAVSANNVAVGTPVYVQFRVNGGGWTTTGPYGYAPVAASPYLGRMPLDIAAGSGNGFYETRVYVIHNGSPMYSVPGSLGEPNPLSTYYYDWASCP